MCWWENGSLDDFTPPPTRTIFLKQTPDPGGGGKGSVGAARGARGGGVGRSVDGLADTPL